MKYRVKRTMSVEWDDEVEVEAENEEDATDLAYDEPTYAPSDDIDIDIGDVTCLEDVDEKPYLPPIGQAVLPGYEDMRKAWVT